MCEPVHKLRENKNKKKRRGRKERRKEGVGREKGRVEGDKNNK